MALSRRGFRRLIIKDRELFWRIIDREEPSFDDGSPGILVDIASDAAFTHGQRGQRLRFLMPTGRTITPRMVRWVAEAGFSMKPPFTGAPGSPDITFSEKDWQTLIEQHLNSIIQILKSRLNEQIIEHFATLVQVGGWVIAVENLRDNLKEFDEQTACLIEPDLSTLEAILGI